MRVNFVVANIHSTKVAREYRSLSAGRVKFQLVAWIPKVFARLPFVRMQPSQKSPLAALGYVDPEKTGEDKSLWVIVAQEIVEFPSIEPHIKEAGLSFKLQQSCRVLAVTSVNHYLVEFDGFITEGDERITGILEAINNSFGDEIIPATAMYVGSYATPITFK